MYCTEAESSFRPCPNRPSSLELFGPSAHSSSIKGSPQHIPKAFGHGYLDNNQQPKRLQEEDLIGRLDECLSDANSANYSTVDCTLSLGTPSTRYSSTKQGAFTSCMEASPSISRRDIASDPFKGTCSSNTWNNSSSTHANTNSNGASWQVPLDYSRDMSFVNAKQGRTTTYGNMFNQNTISNGRMNHKSGRNGSENASSVGRKCANCDTTTTPLWRNGPKGPKSLCNACGIRYKKEERRTAACTDPHQVKKNNQDDIYENSYNMNMLHGCCSDDINTNNREASCLTWQGNSCVYLRPNSMLSMQQTENNIPRPLPTSSYAEEGPTLLFGRSVN